MTMRTLELLSFLLLPIAVVSISSLKTSVGLRDGPSLDNFTSVAPIEPHMGELHRRALDLSGAIDDLLGLIGPLFQLLKPATLQNINIIIGGASMFITHENSQILKKLIAGAYGLLKSDAFKNLSGLLDDLAPLLDSLDENLITKLTALLDNASILLTKDFAVHVRDLINNLAPLLKYVGQLIAALISFLFGGSSGSGNGSDSDSPSSTGTTPNDSVPTATSTSESGSDWSLTIPDSFATSTEGFDWGSWTLGSGDDDSSFSSAVPTETSGSSWDFSGSGSSEGSDSSSSSSDDIPSETSSDSASFTGGANRAGFGSSCILGVALLAIAFG